MASPDQGRKEREKGIVWKGALCRYGYDAAEGDRENGRVLGITFEDLPDDWMAPEWRTSKAIVQEAEE
jgi:rubredoxin